MIRTGSVTICAIAVGSVALAQPSGRRAESPAASPVPETLREQS
jgi:hypothetical protein